MTTPDADTPVQESIRATELLPEPPEPEDLDLHDKSLYIGRELSWLDFNDRVLQLAEDPSWPLLERVKMAAIWSSNLDEFFQIRVAGVHEQMDAGLTEPGPDGLTPSQTIDAIRERVVDQQQRLEHLVVGELFGELAEHGIRVVGMDDISARAREGLAERFQRQIFPALTPLAVGPGRPFPYISSLSLSLAVVVRDPVEDTRAFARIKVAIEMLPRFMALDDDPRTFIAVEEVIAANLGALFPGMEIVSHTMFRVTRDADFEVSDEADDLLQAVEAELRRRRLGEAVRLEVAADTDPDVRQQLTDALGLEPRQVYEVDGLLDTSALWQIYGIRGFGELRDAPWTPVTQPRLQGQESERVNFLAEMRRGDILVHHPYDSFATSVERFVEQAVADPDVLAIKQTVYRTSDDSPLVPALIRATERGKQAVCMVELKARFDERANITWARKLEEAGVHVVYGHPGLKTHAKCILVVRREGDGVAPLRPHRHRQLPPEDRAPVHGLRPLHDRREDRRGRRRHVQLPHRHGAPGGLPQAAHRPERHARGAARGDRRDRRGPRARRARADRAEDELARRPPGHPRAVPRVARGRAGRPQRARHLLPAPRRRRRVGQHHGRQRARPLPRALAHLLVRARGRRSACSSARRTSCRATSTSASSSSRPSTTPRCATTCSTRSSARSPPMRAPGSCARAATGSAARPATRRARCSASS